MNEWHIQPRAHACQISGQPFEDQQAYFTLLLEEGGELRRLDVCEAVWKERSKGAVTDMPGYVSHWKGVYEAPPPAPPETIRRETAETLLRKLIEQDDPRHGAACYILAVMLERKRLLRVKEQFRREGRRIFLYEQPKTGDLFTITDPDLHLDQLETVQRDVADLLEHGVTDGETPTVPEDGREAKPAINAEAQGVLAKETPVGTE